MGDQGSTQSAIAVASSDATVTEHPVINRTPIDRREDAPAPDALAELSDDDDAPILYRPDFRPPVAANRRFWIAGTALMLFLLLIQGITYFRDSLARDVPSMKPFLTTYCNIVGCELKLPRNADAITIESSDLKQFPDRPREILLLALLRNRAEYAQAFPSLELTLTDGTDQPVLKRVFHPADYVEDKTAINRGIAPLQEANVRLRLELIDLAAIGYRLFVFYP